MHRWNVFTRLMSFGSRWASPTSSVPRYSSAIFASRVARASSSFSSPPSSASSSSSSSSFSSPTSPASSSSSTPLENARRTATTHMRQTVSSPSQLAVAKNRGAYDERTIPHVTGYNVKSLAVVEKGKHVEITWEDGKVSRYHSLWLRHTCFCPDCKFDGNGQPKMAYDQIPTDLVLSSAVDDGEGCLVVQWKDEGDHTGVFPLKFLKFHCYSPESMKERRETIRMRYTTEKTIPEVTYDEVMSSDEGVLRWVTYLNRRGICLVKGIPPQPGMGRKVSERITGCVLHTLYGFIEDVKSTPAPINAAYSRDELKLHHDLVYYASPPGLQTLFCVRFDPEIEGGESEYADMFHVAETFREQHPEDFHVLATVPTTYDTIHYNRDWPVHYTQKRTIFALNDDGDLIGVRYQPHHMGPLEVAEDLIEPFYAAYKKFYSMTNNWPHKMSYRLQPGDMMSYNNRRIAHGRAAYKSRGGQERFLQGSSLDVSEFRSRVQSLSNLIGDGSVAHRVGDNDLM